MERLSRRRTQLRPCSPVLEFRFARNPRRARRRAFHRTRGGDSPRDRAHLRRIAHGHVVRRRGRNAKMIACSGARLNPPERAPTAVFTGRREGSFSNFRLLSPGLSTSPCSHPTQLHGRMRVASRCASRPASSRPRPWPFFLGGLPQRPGLVVVDPDLELRGVSCDEWLWCAVAAPGAIPRHLRNIRASRGLPRTRKRAGSSCAGGSRTAPSASGRRRTDPSSPRGAPAAGRDQRGRRPKRELRETKFNSFA